MAFKSSASTIPATSTTPAIAPPGKLGTSSGVTAIPFSAAMPAGHSRHPGGSPCWRGGGTPFEPATPHGPAAAIRPRSQWRDDDLRAPPPYYRATRSARVTACASFPRALLWGPGSGGGTGGRAGRWIPFSNESAGSTPAPSTGESPLTQALEPHTFRALVGERGTRETGQRYSHALPRFCVRRGGRGAFVTAHCTRDALRIMPGRRMFAQS